MSLPPFGIVATIILIGYALFEIGFFLHYHWHLVPVANQIISSRPPAPYRDYPDIKDREKLLHRILDRLDERIQVQFVQPAKTGGNDTRLKSDATYKFIESFFQKKSDDTPYERFSEQFDMATLDVELCPPPSPIIRMAWASFGTGNNSCSDELSTKSSSESLSTLNGSDTADKHKGRSQQNREGHGSTHHGASETMDPKPCNDRIQKGNIDELLSWFFFGVPLSAVQSDIPMQEALDNLYDILQTRLELRFEPGNNPKYVPCSFTFENVKSLYRPYGVYASVALMRMAANCILFVLGFRQYRCERGLRYWHRPAMEQRGHHPFLFFHGIAPGGHAPYLPMLFLGILRGELSHRHRDIFLFENKPISYALCFDALSERDTLHGVSEAMDQHLGTSSDSSKNLTICGHSFGSCQLTWMMKSPELKNKIRTLILLDPVSVLLSDPDVVVNFLYTRQDVEGSYNGNLDSWAGRLIRFINETKIQLVASSELFIQHYLRRSFAGYNSELWLQDVPRDVNCLVCLAECDEIVNTQKVEMEILSHNAKVSKGISCSALVEQVIWRYGGHAHCVTNPEKWSDIHHALRRIESKVLEEDSFHKSR